MEVEKELTSVFYFEKYLEEIIMTYNEFIQNILDIRGRFNCGDEYHERHHIIPKCIGGDNKEENLIDLFAKEHFEVHRLLALENPENEGLVYAWWMMSHNTNNNTQDRYELTPEEYEEAKKAFSKVSSERAKQYVGDKNPNYGNHKLAGENAPWYGKHLPKEVRVKISEKAKGRKLPIEVVRKVAEVNRGSHRTLEQKQRMSEAAKRKYLDPNNHLIGDKHPMFGKHHSEETKHKIGDANKGEKNDCYGKIGVDSPLSVRIHQYDKDGNFIKLWYGAMEIERTLGLDHSTIIKCCKHKPHYKSAGGYLWFYADDPAQPDKSKIITQQID